MKKVLIPLSMGLLVFASCKKDYTCECTNTNTYTSGGTSVANTETVTTVFTDVTKKAVTTELDCYSKTNSYTTGPASDPVNVEVKSECSLKK